MSLFERRAAKVVDELFDSEERKRYGNPILTWILIQVVMLVAKKLLERIIADDGKEITALAKTLLEKVEEEQ